ncbi:MAG TPA: hypothetical protein VF773_21320 [Verrucomicrobiae bacterium]
MDAGIAIVLGLFIVVPLFLAWLVWYLTRDIKRYWLRSMVRSAVLAAALTWTIVPIEGVHGALPMPAFWILLTGIFNSSGGAITAIRHGGLPLLAVFSVLWALSLVVGFCRRERGQASLSEEKR